MALVGAATRDRMTLQFRTLQQLSGHFLDVVGGLGTLKVFGRAKAQIQTIGEVTDRYRRATISTLRVTFMSSLILELVATISVALVAVEIGLRLMGGHLGLRTALIVLVLAPEAYLPLRLLGANYHASAEGMSAARQVFDVLETPLPAHGHRTETPDPALTGLTVDDLRVQYPGPRRARHRWRLAGPRAPARSSPSPVPADAANRRCWRCCSASSRRRAARSGSADRELADLDPDAWRARVSWMPQRPHLFAASIAENIALGRPDATTAEIWDAVDAAGLRDVVARQARRARHGPRRSWRRPVGRRAPAGRAGPSLSPRRPPAVARRADRQPRRRHRGRGAGGAATADARPQRRSGRAPSGAGGAGRPGGRARPLTGDGMTRDAHHEPAAHRQAPLRSHAGTGTPGRGAAGGRRAAGGRGDRCGHRADRHLGVADLPRVSATGGVIVGDRDRRRAVLRPVPGPVPIRTAAGRPRRGVPGVGGSAGHHLHAAGDAGAGRPAGVSQRRSAGAARPRHRLAAGPAAASDRAVPDRAAGRGRAPWRWCGGSCRRRA